MSDTIHSVRNNRELRAAIGSLGPADTIVLKPGRYEAFDVRAPEVSVVAQHRWQAEVSGGVRLFGDGSAVMGLWIDGSERFGVELNGNGQGVLDCWIEHNRHGGVHGIDRTDCIIQRSVIQYNGSHPQFDHGVYLRGFRHRVRDCVVRHNAAWNIHLWDRFQDGQLTNNLVHDSGSGRGVLISNFNDPMARADQLAFCHNTVLEENIALRVEFFEGDIVIANSILRGGVVCDCDGAKFVQNMTREKHTAVDWRPRFVAPGQSVFWLKADSLAIGKAESEYRQKFDQLNMRRKEPADLGCYEYDMRRTREGFRDEWNHAWPYRADRRAIPDPWEIGAIAHLSYADAKPPNIENQRR